MVFEGFYAKFAAPKGQRGHGVWEDRRLLAAVGYRELMSKSAGCSFDNGLYRLHDRQTGPKALELIDEAFPAFAGRACPFGFDWLGRQFALDEQRISDGQSLVLMFEPGTGEALEIPLPFSAFHEQLDDLREPALAAGFFAQWSDLHPGEVPLSLSECVGYRVPLFLGGKDTIDNLEKIDVDVYWTLSGQLLQGRLNLPDGSSIGQVSIQD